MDALLDQKQVAQMIGVSIGTLERHRVAGTGPRWARLGRLVRYRQVDVLEWIEANLRRSTSETVGNAPIALAQVIEDQTLTPRR